ncbi:N-6 DNA methylase [Panacibacter ginsenosidivorans]|uniref:site-specific DNA-methyltransferase (adenine-specific) n=1 Tax=Panacibacter ginsenosidivorans TaxID=1813871 RepID=A0A5B8VGB1_9BACT|nr:type ISP restriction/modification enzyme [Panacibacter ginsenosidivorans]QEC69616.1 N-6 DNA methylase [Panacibacter ginsenosidivorans]
MNFLEKYIHNLVTIKRSGMAVKETSYYGSLESFLNEIGSSLKPTIRAIINTKNTGSGIPDGGLFTKDQFLKDQDRINDFLGTPPSRGVIEIKGTSDDVDEIAKSDQIKKYLKGYGQVLVTNYYQFLLVVLDENKEVKFLEKYSLSGSEKEFWELASNPKNIDSIHGESLKQFLLRVMLHTAPLLEPKDVAWFLASYARDAKTRIEQLELPALDEVKKALEETLGVSFAGKKGSHFFKSTLIQTIFYGVFSAWILFNKDKTVQSKKFDWRLAGWYLKVPMIKALFERVANPSQLGRLGIIEVLDWATDTLNRIERLEFFERFKENEAVLYFYEPFLEAFDPELRKDLGVWYTPHEVVSYMVEKVDFILRKELNIKRGLANDNVFVLDPACGTGAYLVEVLKRIHKTHEEEGADALSGEDLKEAARNRIFGFEILPAPFVIAHLQLGLLLQNLGANFIEESDRVGIYLTNSLTGWNAPKKKDKQLIAYPEMQEEKDAAEFVKQEKPILVILGNPPYNAFAGASPEEEGGLVDPYKKGLISEWGIKKFNLDELYVRFFRLSERRVAEVTGKGIVSFISNFSYLRDPSFVVMRKHLLSNFDNIWIDCMNGDSRETGKTTPDGLPDPSVFSTSFNKAGIRTGTTITTLVKTERSDLTEKSAKVNFRQFWGKQKLKDLIASQNLNNYTTFYTSKENWHNLYPKENTFADYQKWVSITHIFLKFFVGLEECRGGDLMNFDFEELRSKMDLYFDLDKNIKELKTVLVGLTKNYSGFVAENARAKILKKEKFNSDSIKKYLLRPFDTVWAFYSDVTPLWNRPRPELIDEIEEDNFFLITRFKSQSKNEGIPAAFTKYLFDKQTISRNPIAIPYKVKESIEKNLFQSGKNLFIPNLSVNTYKYLSSIGYDEKSDFVELSKEILFHCFSILFCPLYLKENSTNLSIDFPKIPLPNNKEDFKSSSQLGSQIVGLMNAEIEIEGVTINVLQLYKDIAIISKKDGSIISLDNLAIVANWGNKTVQGVMPGKGKYEERNFSKDEYASFKSTGYSEELIHKLLGETTIDVFLNADVYWKNIPLKVWNYHIGGYQVIKKWLSYREESIIKRPLKKEEAREIVNISRRITALCLMEENLNNNYKRVKENTFDWSTFSSSPNT